MSAHSTIRGLLIACALVSTTAGVADAQWLFLGRKVIGKVDSMVQSPDAAQAGGRPSTSLPVQDQASAPISR
jgi:hypothetical protein